MLDSVSYKQSCAMSTSTTSIFEACLEREGRETIALASQSDHLQSFHFIVDCFDLKKKKKKVTSRSS